MRLRLVHKPFDDPDFIFELKHDGFRAVAYIDRGDCRLVSRNLKPLHFRSLRASLAIIDVTDAILESPITFPPQCANAPPVTEFRCVGFGASGNEVGISRSSSAVSINAQPTFWGTALP